MHATSLFILHSLTLPCSLQIVGRFCRTILIFAVIRINRAL